MQRARQFLRVVLNRTLSLLRYALCRIHGDAVAGMNSGPFYMLHNAWYQDILSVAYGIHLDLLSLEIFIYQNRVILGNPVDDADELVDIMVVDGYLHPLASKNVGWPYQNRVPQPACNFFGLFGRKYGSACRPWNLTLLQNLIEQFPVFRSVYILCGCPKNRNAHHHQRFRQFDGCLAPKLDHSPVRLLQIYDAFHIFRRKGLEVKLIRDIKVGADRLRVIIDDDRLIPFLGKCPGTVHGAEVKLDTLSDTDRAGAQNQDLLPSGSLYRLILTAKHRIVVRSLCREFCRAGVNHLIGCRNSILQPHIMNLALCIACQPCDHAVREFQALGFPQCLCV